MSGHSKWSTIKRKKGAVDQQRGAIFAKIAKELTIASKLHGTDPNSNQRLRSAISKAKNFNMPRNTIENAIAKGSQETQKNNLEELIFEAFFPGGIGIIIVLLTDKRSRTTPEIKSILKKYDAQLSTPETVLRLFQLTSEIIIAKEKAQEREERLLEILSEFSDSLIGDWLDLAEGRKLQFKGHLPTKLTDILSKNNFSILSTNSAYLPRPENEVTMNADNQVNLNQLPDFINKLEGHPDVTHVYHNSHLKKGVF